MIRNRFLMAERWLRRLGAGGSFCLLFLINPAGAHAAYPTYELEGTIMTPIYESSYGRQSFTGYYYAQFINKGDLKMVIDNESGRISITGRTHGCVVASGTKCSSDPSLKFGPNQVGAHNVNFGWGYFDWNLYMTGGRGAYRSDDGNPLIVFENMDADIGNVQVVDADPGIKEFIGVGAKKSDSEGYSLLVDEGSNTKDGIVYLTALFEHQYGVLGGHARAESERNSAVAKSWLVGYEVKPDLPSKSDQPSKPLPAEVPAPGTILLLGCSVAGMLTRAREKLRSVKMSNKITGPRPD